MTAMTLPAKPWTNGMLTADQRYQYDSTVGAEGAWRANPVPAGGLPAGSIIQWASNTIPANWLLCDGSAVSRTVYPSLFAAIGTQYGVGDGSTTFNLPDLRGRVAVGKNGGTFGTLGATGGAETVTLTAAQSGIPAHTHPISANSVASYGGGGNYWGMGADDYSRGLSVIGQPEGITVISNTAQNASQAHSILQPYQVTNYIIKATIGVTAGDSQLAVRTATLETNPVVSGNMTVAGTSAFTGRMTKPGQPSFKATNPGGQINDPANPTNLVFSDTTSYGGHNIGGHYNASTGVFTAPVAGRYMFTGAMLTNPAFSSNDPGYVKIMWQINGTNNHYFAHNHNQNWVMEGSAIIFNLAANDYVRLQLLYGSGHYGDWSYFAGYFLG